MSKLTPEWRGMLAAFASNTIYGFSFMFSKIGFQSADPSVVLATRFILAVAAMGLLARFGPAFFRLRFHGLPWKKLGLMCLMEPILYFICESRGIILTNSSFSAVIIALIPIVSLVIALIFLKERPTHMQVVCSCISILGVVVISVVGAGSGTVNLAGVLLLFGATFAAACFIAISRSLRDSVTSFERAFFIFVGGAVFFTIDALLRSGGDVAGFIRPWSLPGYAAALIFLGLFASVLAFTLINYALDKLPVARVTVFSNWTTVVSILAGVFLMKESFTWVQVLGSAMILLGLYGVNRFVHPEREQLAS